MQDDDVFIRKLYVRCMFTSMLALAGAQIGQIASAVIAGRLLESSLSVMAVALPVQLLFSAAGALLGVGCTVVCTRAIGQGRFDECHRTFTIVYILTLFFALAPALVFLPFIDPLVRFLGAGEEIFEDTRRYITVLMLGGVFSMSIYPVYNLLRLDGRIGTSAVLFFIQTAVTISLDLVFLYFFHLGVEAVALAAVSGAAVLGLSGAVLLFTGSKNFKFTPEVFKKNHRRDFFRITGNVIVSGSPSAMESLCILGYSIVLNRLIARSFGIPALSSFKLIDSFNACALIFIYAVSGPVIQFVGVFGAERDSKSIRQLLAQVFKWGVIFILGYTALCLAFAPALAGFFGMTSPEALEASASAIRIFAFSLLAAMINNILVSVYQAENRPLAANILTVSRLFFWIVVTAPALSSRIGVTGIWHSFWIAETLSLLSAMALSSFYRRKNKYLSFIFLTDREAESRGVYKSFSVKNSLESITQSSEGITEFCGANSLGTKLTMAISLAVEEMLVVIREHSLAGRDGQTMNVRVLIEDSTVILRIRSGGRIFDPVDYARNAGEEEEAGVMGVKMILALALNIDYRNTFGVNNTTIFLRRETKKSRKEEPDDNFPAAGNKEIKKRRTGMKKNSIMKRILRAFLLVCLASQVAGGVIMFITLLNIRGLALDESGYIGATAADDSMSSLRDQTLFDITELVEAKSDLIDRQFREAAGGMKTLKGYIERIYSRPEEFRPVRIPNYRMVPEGELRMHWFLEAGTVSNPAYTERDLVRARLREETYLLGNVERIGHLMMDNIPDIFTVYISTKSGQNIQFDREAAMKAGLPDPVLHERPWYTEARDADPDYYVSGAYRDLAGRGLTISMATAFHGKAGEFRGVVGIDIKIDDLDKSIRETVVGKSGYALLINNAGEDGGESEIVSAPDLNERNENNIAAYLGNGAEGILAAMKAAPGGRGQSVITAGGKNTGVYIIWAPVKLTGWRLVYVVPEEDILAPALTLYDNIKSITETSIQRIDRLIFTAVFISASMLLLIILLTSWAARLVAVKIARPVTALSGSIRNIGGGNLDYHSDIHSGDEIEELSLSFERMAEELKGYIENLSRVTAEKERIGAELNIATKIQASMLPRIFPPFPDRREFDIFGSMLPAKEVGGDFYDLFLVNDDTLVFLIADVSGKGVPAALFMVIAKTLIKSNAQRGLSPKKVFEVVNNLLCQDNEAGMFVTAFMACLDIPSGKLTCVNAGHNPPLIKRGGNFEWLKIKPGLILGCMEGKSYTEAEVSLDPGDMLFLYTDGVTEAMNAGGELFTEERLLNAAEAHKEQGVEEFGASIKREIDAFTGNAEQTDDITMLALHYHGTAEEWKELKIKALSENLDAVLDFVNGELEKANCPQKTLMQIDVAVEEIFVNIARYAYNPETGFAVVRIQPSGSEIRFEFEDEGKPYNPLEKADPDITAPIDERPVGGLGVFIVKKVMDTVEYRYTGSSNLLALKKTIV